MVLMLEGEGDHNDLQYDHKIGEAVLPEEGGAEILLSPCRGCTHIILHPVC